MPSAGLPSITASNRTGDGCAMNDPLGIPLDYGKSRGLKQLEEATTLVAIGTHPDGREIQLAPKAAQAWTRMLHAAAADAVTLVPLSGFRSIARQAEIIRAKRSAGESLKSILTTVAAPGYSEHHTGRAIDIGTPESPELTEGFAETPAFAWLKAHAAEHGFSLSYPQGNAHGIIYEPWHWCFKG
jgi:zinc D-Ala-D-Ala carboxypeptidase